MYLTTYFRKDFLFGGLFCILCLANCNQAEKQADTNDIKVKAVPISATMPIDTMPETPPVTTYTVIGVGDMMLGTNYPSASYLPANGGKDLLSDVEAYLKNADVTFGNLEGAILDKGGTAKTCSNPSLCYVFRSPESYAQHFVNAGFDVLSIANNHSGDFGGTGRTRTKEVLEEKEIAYAGLAGTDEYTIFERNGIKYGFCAFAPNRGTCSINNLPKAKEIVQKLVAETDVVIVSFHGGAEGAKHQSVPKKNEYFYGENRGDVHGFAHAMIDAGADIIFGHGPHVTRAVELYKDRFIAYSLGNFCTYGRFSLAGPAGIAPIIKLEINEVGAFLGGEIIPIYQQKTHGPKVDPQKRAIHKIIELTKADFPNTPLEISTDGKISKK